MRILVTGAAGFIATNLIPRLLHSGDEVLGVDNFFLGKRSYIEAFQPRPGFEFQELDLLDLDATIAAMARFRPERVWHLAANSDISFGTKYTDFDLKGGTLVTYNVLEAMRRTSCREIVFSSSGAVYGEPTVVPTPEHYGPLLPISLYAASKLACETLITAFAHNYDFSAWIFRFGNIVGPNPTHGAIFDFVRKLLRDRTRLQVLGDGTQAKPYVHVDDCLAGMMWTIEHAPERVNLYNLAVPGQTTVANLARWTVEAMGLCLDEVKVEFGEGSRGWKGDVARVELETSRINALGWRPRLSSDEAARKACIEIAAQVPSLVDRGEVSLDLTA